MRFERVNEDVPGCSIPVVRTIRVRKDRVRFPAARQSFVHSFKTSGSTPDIPTISNKENDALQSV